MNENQIKAQVLDLLRLTECAAVAADRARAEAIALAFQVGLRTEQVAVARASGISR